MAKQSKVSLEAFVEAWEASSSVPEVAEKLGLKVNSVQARASKYRQDYHIPLKAMQRGGGARIDENAARQLLATLRGQSIAEVNAQSERIVADAKVRHAKREAAKAETSAVAGS